MKNTLHDGEMNLSSMELHYIKLAMPLKIGEKPKVNGRNKPTTTHIASSCCFVLYLCHLPSSTSRIDQRRKNRSDVTKEQRRKDGGTTSYNHEEGRGGRTKTSGKGATCRMGKKMDKGTANTRSKQGMDRKRARHKRTNRKGIEHQK